MKEVLEYIILLVWVGIISLAAIGIEKLLERLGYRRSPPGEEPESHVPPLPEG